MELFENKVKWYEKIFDELEFIFVEKPKDIYYSVKWFFHNLVEFLPIIKKWRDFDYSYQVDLFIFGLKKLSNSIKNGNEEEISRTKKYIAINTLIAELERDIDDEVQFAVYGNNLSKNLYEEDGCIKSKLSDEESQKLYNKYSELYKKEMDRHYSEIFRLIKGQDSDELKKKQDEIISKMSKEEKENGKVDGYYKVWSKLFDGSGIQGWWD